MTPTIDLVLTGATGACPDWANGQVLGRASAPEALARAWADGRPEAEALLCWDTTLGPPPAADLLGRLLDGPDDVWHAGLLLGQAGRPPAIDAVTPTWMLNADAPDHIESTSWRVSLRACLARRGVLTCHGFVDPGFRGLDHAALELGHRWVHGGVRARHVPALLHDRPTGARAPDQSRDVDDELRFAVARFGPGWALWAAVNELGPWRGPRAWRRGMRRAPVRAVHQAGVEGRGDGDTTLPPTAAASAGRDERPTVTVLIPTLDRYPYLDTVLDGLGRQRRAPDQVVVVDQTPSRRRDEALADRWPDLPLSVLTLDRPGQSTARNAGLAATHSSHVLFLDDNDELPDDLVGGHLRCHRRFGVDTSCGVAPEPGRTLPPEFALRRPADVLPTNNSMVATERVLAAGGFRSAFDHGARADHDLGMRLHLAGARMLLEPSLRVVHHRAPSGGLRRYGTRATTNEDARQGLWARERLEPTEHLLWDSYYRAHQVRMAERIWILGNFRSSRGRVHQIGRAACQLARLPTALMAVRRARRAARALADTEAGAQ